MSLADIFGKRKTKHNDKVSVHGYPWEAGWSDTPMDAHTLHLVGLQHQMMAMEAAENGVPGSGYPLPPTPTNPPAAVLHGGRVIHRDVISGNPTTTSAQRVPRKYGQFVETSPGQLQVDSGYHNTIPQPHRPGRFGGPVTAQTTYGGASPGIAKGGAVPPMVGLSHAWHMQTAANEYAAYAESVRMTSASAASGGIRGTRRPTALGGHAPLRVTPGVSARTTARTRPFDVGAQGVVVQHPTGAMHPLYGA